MTLPELVQSARVVLREMNSRENLGCITNKWRDGRQTKGLFLSSRAFVVRRFFWLLGCYRFWGKVLGGSTTARSAEMSGDLCPDLSTRNRFVSWMASAEGRRRSWFGAIVGLGMLAALAFVQNQRAVVLAQQRATEGSSDEKKSQRSDVLSRTRRWLQASQDPKWTEELSKLDAAIAAKQSSIAALRTETEALKRVQEGLVSGSKSAGETTAMRVRHHHNRRTGVEKRKFVRFVSAVARCELCVGREAGDDWLRCDRDASEVDAIGAIFELRPAHRQGTVTLRSVATGKLVEMVPPGEELAWVLRASTDPERADDRTAFELVEGVVRNVGTRGCVTVMRGGQKVSEVRGHGNKPHNRAPGSETDPLARFQVRDASALDVARAQELAAEAAKRVVEAASRWKTNATSWSEKRVVSYGLYGRNPKYTTGAIRNSELVHSVFPGWTTRFYVRDDVPRPVLDQLRSNGAEVVEMGKDAAAGNIAGMFWRFLVADDPAVDRFIVRDSDSRLNPREAAAVEEWIASGSKVHSIRDHPNHDRPLNGGLWGGVKHSVPGIAGKIARFTNRASYGGDLQFLNSVVWPLVRDDQLAHDAYTCHKYPNTRPFPTKRPANYQHVGQVFDANDQPRMADINGFLRNRPIPKQCRKEPDWKFG